MVKIFLSHATRDQELASKLEQEIKQELGFENDDIFRSSRLDAIQIEKWFEVIQNKLNEADLFIPLITPCGAKSTWVAFEIGYYWKKAKRSKKIIRIYPLQSPKVNLPDSIKEYESKDFTDIDALREYFRQLRTFFDVPIKEQADYAGIVDKGLKVPLLTAEESKLQMETSLFLRQANTSNERQHIINWMHSLDILQKVNLINVNLEGADFVAMTLYKANLGGANLRGVNFESTNLEDALLGSTKLQGANFKGAFLKETSFQDACMDGNTILPDGTQSADESVRREKFILRGAKFDS